MDESQTTSEWFRPFRECFPELENLSSGGTGSDNGVNYSYILQTNRLSGRYEVSSAFRVTELAYHLYGGSAISTGISSHLEPRES